MLDNYRGGVHAMGAETYSTVWKCMKENQECTNGDYFYAGNDNVSWHDN